MVVSTSLSEGAPVALIEALAAGRPVVATDVGGVGDVVEHGRSGFLAASGDVEGLARAVLDLLEREGLRHEMGRAGRTDVAERYSAHRIAGGDGRPLHAATRSLSRCREPGGWVRLGSAADSRGATHVIPPGTCRGERGRIAFERVSAVCGDALFRFHGGSMPNAEKIEKVAALKERIQGAEALLLAEYRGLSVHDATELRRSLSEQARFAIVKNTLFQRAAADAGVAELETLLDGPTAVAFVEGDVVATAKKVVDAAKKFPALVLKGGYLDGKVLSAAEAQALATLESREVMLSKVAGLMKAETARAASMFQAIQARFLGVLESYRAKLPGEAVEPAAGAEPTAKAEPTADAEPSAEPIADAEPTADAEESPESATEAGNEPGNGSAEVPDEAAEAREQPQDDEERREGSREEPEDEPGDEKE